MADRVIMPRALDSNGDVVSGALAYFYTSGTTDPLVVYSDSGAGTALGTSIQADASGTFVAVYTTTPPRLDIQDANGVSLPGYPSDNWYVTPSTGLGASTITFSPVEGNVATDVQGAIEANTTILNAITSYGKSLIAAANAAAARTILGLGNAAVQGWSTSSDFATGTGLATSRGAIATEIAAQIAAAEAFAAKGTFNGAGLIAGSNVSSVTVNGTGDYTISFTSDLANANYSILDGINGEGSTDKRVFLTYRAKTVSGFSMLARNVNDVPLNPLEISFAVVSN
jgi:hypothetical protein